jgi:hypothetical protein
MIENKIGETITEMIIKRIEEKVKEACNAWNVDVNDPEEIAKRCHSIEKGDFFEGTKTIFYIDNHPVFQFEMPSLQYSKKQDYHIEFSKIMTPEDYGVDV